MEARTLSELYGPDAIVYIPRGYASVEIPKEQILINHENFKKIWYYLMVANTRKGYG